VEGSVLVSLKYPEKEIFKYKLALIEQEAIDEVM
jgi:hypothetical protein